MTQTNPGEAPGEPRVQADAAAPAVAEGPPADERLRTGAGIVLALAAAAGLFYVLAPILAPFALAGVLAYVLNPGAGWLQRRGLPRALASLLMVLLSGLLVLGLILILLPVLEREAIALDQKLPALVTQINTHVLPLLEQWLGVSVHLDATALRALALQQVGQQDAVSALLERFGSGGLALLGAFGTVTLIPVVLFYLLLDAQAFARRCEDAIPRRWHARTVQLLGEVDSVLAQFLRGQLTVMLVLAVYYSVALAVAGFDSALPIGVLTGLLIFIPYVGFALGLILATIAALLQSASWTALLGILVVYGLGQVLEGFFLTPRLVGERIGLHPLAVIFALLAFGHVFGFFGVLVALPASAVLLVALRHLRRRYLASDFYRRT